MIEQWEYWRNRSQNGEVCGIIGCGQQPKNKCPICNNFYCLEHIKVHFHTSEDGSLADSKVTTV